MEFYQKPDFVVVDKFAFLYLLSIHILVFDILNYDY
jgi:hypothetical protein